MKEEWREGIKGIVQQLRRKEGRKSGVKKGGRRRKVKEWFKSRRRMERWWSLMLESKSFRACKHWSLPSFSDSHNWTQILQLIQSQLIQSLFCYPPRLFFLDTFFLDSFPQKSHPLCMIPRREAGPGLWTGMRGSAWRTERDQELDTLRRSQAE